MKESIEHNERQCISDSQILRAKWHDYRLPGFYLITMVTEGRRRMFGRLTGDSESDAHIELSALGKVLEQEIRGQSVRHPEVTIERYVIMEDHCHLFVWVHDPMKTHLGKVVWGIKYGTTLAYLKALDAQDGLVHRVAGVRQSERERTRQGWHAYQYGHTALNSATSPVGCGVSTSMPIHEVVPPVLVPPLWSEGYHDRVVSHKGQIANIKNYILRNPARLWLKRHADHALTRVIKVHVPVRVSLAQTLKDFALYWDERRSVMHSAFSERHDGRHYAESYLELVQKFLRYNAKTGDVFMRLCACGNVGLLSSGRPLVRVRLSRSVTREQFIEEMHRLLDLCERDGAILVSPFISWSEKEMLKIARLNGFDHIVIRGESMSDVWKPSDTSLCNYKQKVPLWWKDFSSEIDFGSGKYKSESSDIDLTYQGHMLTLAPWWDRPRGEKEGKADCEIMNEMCRVMEQIMT